MNVNYCSTCVEIFDGAVDGICPRCMLPLSQREFIPIDQISKHLIQKNFIAKIIVVGEGNPKARPSKFTAKCTLCNEQKEIDLDSKEGVDLLYRTLFDGRVKENILPLLPRSGCTDSKRHDWYIEPTDYKDYKVVMLRRIVSADEVGERSNIVRTSKAIWLGTIPLEKRFVIEARVVRNIRNDDLEIIIVNTKPVQNEALTFQASPEDLMKLKSLQTLTDLDSCLEFALKNYQPLVIGRSDAKLAALLTSISPMWISVENNRQVGCLTCVEVGDPRTAKGMIARFVPEELGLGELAIGESASRAGIAYYVDAETDTIVWGILVQADMTLAVIEAVHGFGTEEMMQFREALHRRKVIVTKKVSGEAWARTRIIADANPSKSMVEFVYRCQAIRNVRTFADPIDITRVDLMIPFAAEDVPDKDVAEAVTAKPLDEEGKEFLRKLILWAWSRKIDQIHFTDEAVKMLKDSFIELLQKYALNEIPLVHRASMWSLARIATSFAMLMFSSPDDQQLVVEGKHVSLAKQFLQRIFSLWELQEYKDVEGTDQPTEDEVRKFVDLMKEEVPRAVVKALSKGGMKITDLAEKIEHNRQHVSETVSKLQSIRVVRKTLRGVELSGIGATLVRNHMDDKGSSVASSDVCVKCGKPNNLVSALYNGKLVPVHEDCAKSDTRYAI